MPYLTADKVLLVFLEAIKTLSYDIDQISGHLFDKMDTADRPTALSAVLSFENIFYKSKILESIFPLLNAEEASNAWNNILNLHGYDLSYSLDHLARFLSQEQMQEVVGLISSVSDNGDRGRLLAALVPRHRELNLPLASSDAYRMSFAIGDRVFGELASAALRISKAADGDHDAKDALARRLTNLNLSARGEELAALIVLIIFASWRLEGDLRQSILERCTVRARAGLVEPSQLFTVLSIVSARLGPEDGQSLRAEAMQIARSKDIDFSLIAMASIFYPRDEALEFLRSKISDKFNGSEESDVERQRIVQINSIFHIFLSDIRESALADSIKNIILQFQNEIQSEDALVIFFFTAVLSPRLPGPVFGELIGEIRKIAEQKLDGEGSRMMIVLLSPYLANDDLFALLRPAIDLARRTPRVGFLMMLALLGCVCAEIWEFNPTLGGNMIPESPLARIGGDFAMPEIADAVAEICEWWP